MQIYIFLIYFTVVTGATDGIGKGYTHQVYYKGRSWSWSFGSQGRSLRWGNRGSCLGKKYMQKNIKTIKFYFDVLNKGTINKLTD